MSDERIFGSFTVRQVILFGGAFGVAYIIYGRLEYPFDLIVFVLVLLAIYSQRGRFQRPEITEEYLRLMKQNLANDEAFQKKLSRLKAEYEAKRHMRREKGFMDDEKLNREISVMERYIQSQ